MKKQSISTLLIVGCICIFQSCATTPFTTTSVYFGGVHSRLPGSSDSWSGAFGLQAGAGFQIPYTSQLPISSFAELNFSMQGANWEEEWDEGLTKGTTRLWYLNIPLMTRYQFDNGFYAEAGLQPGFLLSAKDNYNDFSYNYKEYVKTFDLGLPLGVGFEFPNNFGVGLRVIPGLTNINTVDPQDYKNRNFVVVARATYTFRKQ